MKMITFPASFNITTKNAKKEFDRLVSQTGMFTVSKGFTYNKPLTIMGRIINPKIVLKNANLLKATVARGSTDSTGRYMLINYSIQVKDIKGVTHKLGNFWASATFTPCSNLVESLYLPRELTTNQVQSFIETFPKVSKVTTTKSAHAGRRLMESCASAAAAGPQAAAGFVHSAVHAVAPYLPFVQYDPTRRSLAEIQGTADTTGVTTAPLAASPPPPPSSGSRNQNSTLSTVGAGLVNGTNTILASPAMQNATVNFSNSTFTCPGSSLDNMQFCDGWSGTGTYGKYSKNVRSHTFVCFSSFIFLRINLFYILQI
jgi:hypothetical protein